MRFKLKTDNGMGLALVNSDHDALLFQRGYHIQLSTPANAIEVETDAVGHITLVGGHHKLKHPIHGAFCLHVPWSKPTIGTRLEFNTHKHEPARQFTVNDDGTISPKGARQVVVGWHQKKQQAQLVGRNDAARLQFLTPGHAAASAEQRRQLLREKSVGTLRSMLQGGKMSSKSAAIAVQMIDREYERLQGSVAALASSSASPSSGTSDAEKQRMLDELLRVKVQVGVISTPFMVRRHMDPSRSRTKTRLHAHVAARACV